MAAENLDHTGYKVIDRARPTGRRRRRADKVPGAVPRAPINECGLHERAAIREHEVLQESTGQGSVRERCV